MTGHGASRGSASEIDEQTKLLPSNPVTLQRDVPTSVVFFVRENQARFQGVSVDRVYVRQYPQGSHGRASPRLREGSERRAARRARVRRARGRGRDRPGRCRALLRQRPSRRERRDQGAGRRLRHAPPDARPSVREPSQGNDLVLSLDSDLQRRARQGLTGRSGRLRRARRGERRDPRDGLSADLRSHGPRQARDLERDRAGDLRRSRRSIGTGAPAFNRAIAAGYPTGSTFKPITALAALDADKLTAVGDHQRRRPLPGGHAGVQERRGLESYGPIALREALQVSSDVFFYTLGARLEESDRG